MALITCPDCGASVSDKAIACPSCGHPINATFRPHSVKDSHEPVLNGRNTIYLWMGIAIIATIFALFSLLSTCNWKVV